MDAQSRTDPIPDVNFLEVGRFPPYLSSMPIDIAPACCLSILKRSLLCSVEMLTDGGRGPSALIFFFFIFSYVLFFLLFMSYFVGKLIILDK